MFNLDDIEDIQIQFQELDFLQEGKFCIKNVLQIYNYFFEDENVEWKEEIIEWLYHASCYKNTYERNTIPFLKYEN